MRAGDTGSPDAALADANPGDGGSGYDPPVVTTPIPSTADDTWVWVPIDGAICRDGSATGIGINRHSSSSKLVIFLAGGGECFDDVSCASNPRSYDATDFANEFMTPSDNIFSRTDAKNPLADWNFIFIPYCTGDLHGGNNPGGVPLGSSGPQQYVGYVDMALALARIVPTFTSVTEVLLTGISAGGAGVTLTYLQTAKAFGSTPVFAIDDSGPPMSSTYLTPCLQNEWATLYRFDRTVLSDCGSGCSPTSGNTAIEVMKTSLSRYPSSPFGVVDSLNDNVISGLYDYGLDDCAYLSTMPATPYPPDTFAMGQLDTRTQLAAYPNFGSFLFSGTEHTSLKGPAYETRTATDGGLPLTTWVGALVDGTVTNAGP